MVFIISSSLRRIKQHAKCHSKSPVKQALGIRAEVKDISIKHSSSADEPADKSIADADNEVGFKIFAERTEPPEQCLAP